MIAPEEVSELLKDREVIVEITTAAGVARVTAVDAETGIEVVSIGPPKAAASDLERLAMAKLARALKRAASGPPEPPPPSKPRRGLIA